MSKDKQQGNGTAGSDMRTALTTASNDQPAAVDATINRMLEEQKDVLAAIKAVSYGAVECNASDGAVSDRFGKKSCAAIEAMVTVAALGIKIPVTIWGRLAQTSVGSEITFEASAPRGHKFIGDGKTMLLAHVENAAAAWTGYDKATTAAEARLLGIGETMRSASGETISRPKLVKRVVVSAAPIAAA